MFFGPPGVEAGPNMEEFEVNVVCPNRTLGMQIDGKKPPFRVKPIKLPSTETEIKEGNILIGIDGWNFVPETPIADVLKAIRSVMASDQPVIKLLLQRAAKDNAGPSWTCQRCTMVNANTQSICTTCGLQQRESMTRLNGVQTDWKCPSCTYENPSDKETCVMCETARSRVGEQKEYVPAPNSGGQQMDEQLKIALDRSLSNQPNAYQSMANTWPTQAHPNAPALRASEKWRNQQGNQMQWGQAMMAPNQQPSMGPNQQPMPIQQPFENQPPPMPNYSQYPPRQPQPPQQHPYMQQFPQGAQQQPNPQGYMEGQLAQVPEPKSVRREPKPEPELVKKLPSWKCGMCTTSNDAESLSCTTCRALRMSEGVNLEQKLHLRTAMKSVLQRKAKWKCPYCHYENSPSDAHCLMCSRTPPQKGDYEVRADPKDALEAVDRKKIAMAWLQKQLILENRCRAADFDAAFRRADHRVTEAVFRLTSGFQNLDMFKGKLERFIGGQVGSLKRMGDQMEGRLQKVGDELENVATRYQETTDFLNITQQEIDEKSYLKEYQSKLDELSGQEENLKHHLEEIKVKKDSVTLKMRSEQINKKLQKENCEKVVKQLKEQLTFLRTEKNDLDVQSEIIRQQVNNYGEMRRSLENVKLNDLKSAVKTFQPKRKPQNYSQKKEKTSSPLEFKKVKNTASRRGRQESPQVQSQESLRQSTPEQENELPKHQEDFLEFFAGENMERVIPKPEGDTLEENTDDVLFRK